MKVQDWIVAKVPTGGIRVRMLRMACRDISKTAFTEAVEAMLRNWVITIDRKGIVRKVSRVQQDANALMAANAQGV